MFIDIAFNNASLFHPAPEGKPAHIAHPPTPAATCSTPSPNAASPSRACAGSSAVYLVGTSAPNSTFPEFGLANAARMVETNLGDLHAEAELWYIKVSSLALACAWHEHSCT